MKKTSLNITKKLVFTIFAFLLFGLIMIYDSTFIYSLDVYGNFSKFVLLQIGWILIGSVCFYFFYNYDYKKIAKIAYPLFLFSFIFLILLALFGVLPCSLSIPFAPCINGANRWFFVNPSPLPPLPFLGVIGFQPAELAKITLILYLGLQLSKADENDSFWLYLITTGVFAILIILQPNLSTALMVFLIGSMMYFSSGFSLKPLFVTGPIILFLAILLMIISPYRRERVATFLSGSGNKEDEGYHSRQISIALGSGGFNGLGFGQSRQKYNYLPEVASDSIFAIIGEELGFLGTSVVVIGFSYFLYLGFSIIKHTKDLLGKVIATGIVSWMGLQFFINAAAMTKLIPLTGVPMPLISYGGSSMVFSLIGLGILANISKSCEV